MEVGPFPKREVPPILSHRWTSCVCFRAPSTEHNIRLLLAPHDAEEAAFLWEEYKPRTAETGDVTCYVVFCSQVHENGLKNMSFPNNQQQGQDSLHRRLGPAVARGAYDIWPRARLKRARPNLWAPHRDDVLFGLALQLISELQMYDYLKTSVYVTNFFPISSRFRPWFCRSILRPQP